MWSLPFVIREPMPGTTIQLMSPQHQGALEQREPAKVRNHDLFEGGSARLCVDGMMAGYVLMG